MTGRVSPMTQRNSLTAVPARAVMGEKAMIAMSGGVKEPGPETLAGQGIEIANCPHISFGKESDLRGSGSTLSPRPFPIQEHVRLCLAVPGRTGKNPGAHGGCWNPQPFGLYAENGAQWLRTSC